MAEESDVVEIDPTVRATLAEIEEARRHIAESIQRLKQSSFMNPLDWSGWVGNHPVQSTLGAAAVGFMLAQPEGDGKCSSVLGSVTRTGIESLLPLLLRNLL